MTKQEMAARLTRESWNEITRDMNWVPGQCCDVVKEGFDIENPDQICYIKDTSVGGRFPLNRPVEDKYELKEAMSNVYSVSDFLLIANGLEWFAELLYEYVDWQSPNVDDYLDQDVWSIAEWVEYYGEPYVKDWIDAGFIYPEDYDDGDYWIDRWCLTEKEK